MELVTAPGTTLRYKTTPSGLGIHIDVWPPASDTLPQGNGDNPLARPAFLYFHGGALAFGNRSNFTPTWLFERITALGYVFISADYRLLPSSTGHEILEDIQDVWNFISNPELTFKLPVNIPGEGEPSLRSFKVDSNAISVGGTSAGGFCVYLAAMHCVAPKPKAVLSIYGMGGDIFSTYYLSPKTEKFMMAPRFFDETSKEDIKLLYPYPPGDSLGIETADSPLVIKPDEVLPNSRCDAAWAHLQFGIWLDYFTGEHEPSLSKTLRTQLGFEAAVSPNDPTTPSCHGDDGGEARRKAIEAIPKHHHHLFPQLNVSKEWPPVFLMHGTADTAVPIVDSENLERLLSGAGATVEHAWVPGMEHNFDFGIDVKVKWKAELDAAINFIEHYTSRSEEREVTATFDWSMDIRQKKKGAPDSLIPFHTVL